MNGKNDNPTSTTNGNSISDDLTKSSATEIAMLSQKLVNSSLPMPLLEKALLQLTRINSALKYGGNINALDNTARYIDIITRLPWQKKSDDKLDLAHAKAVMDKNHHGLNAIKQRVLEYLSVLILQKGQSKIHTHAPVLFFVGLAGTGKTTFAMSVAETLGRPLIRIPFGGFSSALDLRGLSKLQPEAEPGAIIKALIRTGVKNPVILLDEIDRGASEIHADLMGVLLELLDPEQNENFIDHYVDYPFDLSSVMFIATANNTKNISTAVMDRLETVTMPAYSDEEKIVIARDFILPRLLAVSGVDKNFVSINDSVWASIARTSGFDPGIRSVERKVESLVRRVALKMVSGQGKEFNINEGNMRDFVD